MADTADVKKKLPRENTFQSLIAAEQARNTTLGQILSAIESNNTNIASWAGALSALNTTDKSSLIAAINEVKGENNSQTASINALKDIYATLDELSDEGNGAAIHSNLYRGKNLGSSLTSTQIANIANGTFKDLYVGDYWEKSITFSYKDANNNDATTSKTGTYKMYVAHQDYRYRTVGTTSPAYSTHHILVVPAIYAFFQAPMNATDTTDGGYALSKMKTTYLDGALNGYKAFFGAGHLLQHKQCFVNAVTNGYPSGGLNYDTYVDLMSEVMVFGTQHHAPMGTGTISPYNYTYDTSQLALYRLNPFFKRLAYIWLRDVVNATQFAFMSYSQATKQKASYVSGNVVATALIY